MPSQSVISLLIWNREMSSLREMTKRRFFTYLESPLAQSGKVLRRQHIEGSENFRSKGFLEDFIHAKSF